MKKSRTPIALAGAALLVLLSLGGSAAYAATPSPPYENTDPAATGCSVGAVVIASYPIKSTTTGAVVGTAEMRYSAACDTNWVRANNTVAGTTANKYIDRISTYNPGPPMSGYPFGSQFDADYGLGWSYGFQLGAASSTCNHMRAWLTDSSGTIVATSGTQTVC